MAAIAVTRSDLTAIEFAFIGVQVTFAGHVLIHDA